VCTPVEISIEYFDFTLVRLCVHLYLFEFRIFLILEEIESKKKSSPATHNGGT
jgi:hypothetical protein